MLQSPVSFIDYPAPHWAILYWKNAAQAKYRAVIGLKNRFKYSCCVGTVTMYNAILLDTDKNFATDQ